VKSRESHSAEEVDYNSGEVRDGDYENAEYDEYDEEEEDEYYEDGEYSEEEGEGFSEEDYEFDDYDSEDDIFEVVEEFLDPNTSDTTDLSRLVLTRRTERPITNDDSEEEEEDEEEEEEDGIDSAEADNSNENKSEGGTTKPKGKRKVLKREEDKQAKKVTRLIFIYSCRSIVNLKLNNTVG